MLISIVIKERLFHIYVVQKGKNDHGKSQSEYYAYFGKDLIVQK